MTNKEIKQGNEKESQPGLDIYEMTAIKMMGRVSAEGGDALEYMKEMLPKLIKKKEMFNDYNHIEERTRENWARDFVRKDPSYSNLNNQSCSVSNNKSPYPRHGGREEASLGKYSDEELDKVGDCYQKLHSGFHNRTLNEFTYNHILNSTQYGLMTEFLRGDLIVNDQGNLERIANTGTGSKGDNK